MMQAQLALQQAMIQQFHEFKNKNSAYSLRAYARRLQLNSGVLSSILNGRRKVSAKMAAKILGRMAIDPFDTHAIQTKFAVEKVSQSKTLEAKKVLQLKSDQFQIIADGIHFTLLCLMETKNFRSDIDWISERVQESPQKVQAAIDRLIRLDLIKIDKKGRYTLTGVQLQTTDGISDAAIRRYHIERLSEAQEKIQTIPVGDRYERSSTYAIKKSQLPKARKLIQEFTDRMQNLLEVEDKDEVYRFNIQLVPLTKLNSIKDQE